MTKKALMIAYTKYSSDSRVKHEAEALVEEGFEVDFICLKEADKKNKNSTGVNLLRVKQEKSKSSNKKFYILSYLEFFLRAFFITSWYYSKKKYEIVHVNNIPDFLVFTALIPKLFGTKIILDIHDPLPETFLAKYEGSNINLIYSILLWIEQISSRFADSVITVSDPIKNEILVKHGTPLKKIHVISNFADQKLFTFNTNYQIGEKIKLIFHGTIAERFGIDNVLKALTKIKDNKRFEFRIIGTGDYAVRIKYLIKQLNLNHIVKFDNRTYNVNDLPQILKEFHVGVISYNISPATEYMLPVKLMEYFSMGIPVIAPKTKVISHYFEDDLILYYEPSKPEQIIDLLENLAEKKDLLTKIREKEYLNRDKFNWETEKIKYKNIVYSLMKDKDVKKN